MSSRSSAVISNELKEARKALRHARAEAEAVTQRCAELEMELHIAAGRKHKEEPRIEFSFDYAEAPPSPVAIGAAAAASAASSMEDIEDREDVKGDIEDGISVIDLTEDEPAPEPKKKCSRKVTIVKHPKVDTSAAHNRQCDAFLGVIHFLKVDGVHTMVQRGFNVNGPVMWHGRKVTPLGLACILKSPSAVEALISSGAEMDVGTLDGDTQTPYQMLVSWRDTQPALGSQAYNDYIKRMRSCAKHLAMFGATLDIPAEVYEIFRRDVDTLLN